jgi:hypothetical protein
LFAAIAAVLLAAPYLVAKLAFQVSETTASRKLDAPKIARYWLTWSVTIVASIGLIIMQWHEFSLLSGLAYLVIGTIVSIVSLCILMVASTDPA